MELSLGELERAVDAGAIRTRAVGPGVRLYQVIKP
jgi:hypothetical protein